MNVNRFAIFNALALLVTLLAQTNVSRAHPVSENFVNDDRCDDVAETRLTHELGGPNDLIIPLPGTGFPIDELIHWRSVPTTRTTCWIAADSGVGDWQVSITNMSGIAWTSLFFVADSIFSVGNADGEVVTCAPDCDAFKIDHRGINPNLTENGLPGRPLTRFDGIFAPGETWDFRVTDFFIWPLNVPAPMPSFNSLGVNSLVNLASTASIIALRCAPEKGARSSEVQADEVCDIPEPSGIVLVFLGLGALLRKRCGFRCLWWVRKRSG